jgi:hypothetical protein
MRIDEKSALIIINFFEDRTKNLRPSPRSENADTALERREGLDEN